MFGILSTLSLPQPLLDPRPAIPLSESSQKGKAKVTVMSDHSDQNPLAWVPHTCIVIEKSLAGLAPPGAPLPAPCAPCRLHVFARAASTFSLAGSCSGPDRRHACIQPRVSSRDLPPCLPRSCSIVAPVQSCACERLCVLPNPRGGLVWLRGVVGRRACMCACV
jgi:hypothetical protein